ncbi:membrane protein [Asticcacaulis sp. AC460]|uniref:EamA family transporter n=1 Tax=Asticcacaulis sp. AC460 TaxID=1282360 RepID=UPI0003C3CEA6|nr:DMT family transporter [Asticcacaulis sp. AC460]ESQ86639.1 membrane protein [Asticcacaulis sp. AC460]
MSVHAKSWPIPAVLIAIVSVQIGASLAKHLFPLIGAEGTTALRQAFSAIVLIALFQPWKGGPKTRADWGLVLLYGGLLGVMNLVFYMAVQRLPLGIAVAIEFAGPLTVAILASRRWLDAVWVACAIAGLAILLPFHGGAGALDLLGVVFACIAGVCWGLYIILGQKVSDRVHGGKAVAIGMAFSTLFTVPIGIAHAGAQLFEPQILLWGLGLAILSGAIPYTLEMLALKHIPAKTFGLMMSLEPAVAALAALVLLHELLTGPQWLAIGLVIIASAGSSLTSKRAAEAPN